VIGNDLQSCREALLSDSGDSLHLVERTNISLQVQNSIVPSVVSLARIKVSGELPTLRVNVSDMKYKSLMRLIDVCIPHLNDDGAAEISAPPAPLKTRSDSFSLLPPKLFSRPETEYYVEDGDETIDTSTLAEEQYFEAEDGDDQVRLSMCVFRLLISALPEFRSPSA
jgi:vacuolar protein sorting-associated protein 13A/C